MRRAYVRDPSGQMTFDEAQRQVQTPYRGAFADPFGPRVVWVRLRVEPTDVDAPLPSAGNEPTMAQLRVIPMWLHELTLYDPLQPDASRPAGRDTAPAAAPFTVRMLPIAVGTAPRDLWLRLQSAGPSYLAVEALSADAAAARTVAAPPRNSLRPEFMRFSAVIRRSPKLIFCVLLLL